MERRVHAVAGVVAHDAVAEAPRVRLDHAADHRDRAPGLDGLDGAVERLEGALGQQARLLVDVAAVERGAVIAVHAVVEGGAVDLDQVAVLERAEVRDAVADDLVDRGADRLREPAVAERRRVRAVVQHVLVRDGVELVGGDAGGDRLCGLVHRVRRDLARDAHLRDHLVALHVRSCVPLRPRPADVLRARDRPGNVAERGDGVRGDRIHARQLSPAHAAVGISRRTAASPASAGPPSGSPRARWSRN